MKVGSHGRLPPNDGEQWQLTDHQKGMPGPAKFEMTQADFSGRANADIQFIADRLAILNHMTAYSFLLDEGRWDAWYELFAEDVVLQITTPSVGALTVKGKDAMKALRTCVMRPGRPPCAVTQWATCTSRNRTLPRRQCGLTS